MLTAYLYHRGDRTLKQLDANGVRQSQPTSPAEMARRVAHHFPFPVSEKDEDADDFEEDGEHENGESENEKEPENGSQESDSRERAASSGKTLAENARADMTMRNGQSTYEGRQDNSARVSERNVLMALPSRKGNGLNDSNANNGNSGNANAGSAKLPDLDGNDTYLNGDDTNAYSVNGNEAQGKNATNGVVPGKQSAASRQAAKNSSRKSGIKGAFRGTTARCRAGELLWVDISAPTEEDYQLLIDRFALHPMVIEDLKAREGRPKLHDYGEYLYIIFHALSREREDGDEKTQDDEFLLSRSQSSEPRVVLKIQEIDCLIGSDYAITLHPETVKPFEDLKKRWTASPDLMRAGSSQLLYELMDEVLDEYFPLLDDFDEDVNQLEEQLFDSDTDGHTQQQQRRTSSDIFAFKRALVQVRRIAGPTRDIANVLLRRDAEAGGKHFAYYQDLYDHASRIVDMVDTFRDILSGLHDSYLAMASNRMNEVMKTLTSASIMLLVPGLIAGIYGMNFENMPELHSHNGYFITLGVMGTIVAVLFAVFKKIDWL